VILQGGCRGTGQAAGISATTHARCAELAPVLLRQRGGRVDDELLCGAVVCGRGLHLNEGGLACKPQRGQAHTSTALLPKPSSVSPKQPMSCSVSMPCSSCLWWRSVPAAARRIRGGWASEHSKSIDTQAEDGAAEEVELHRHLRGPGERRSGSPQKNSAAQQAGGRAGGRHQRARTHIDPSQRPATSCAAKMRRGSLQEGGWARVPGQAMVAMAASVAAAADSSAAAAAACRVPHHVRAKVPHGEEPLRVPSDDGGQAVSTPSPPARIARTAVTTHRLAHFLEALKGQLPLEAAAA
jgi:hypothetical protein